MSDSVNYNDAGGFTATQYVRNLVLDAVPIGCDAAISLVTIAIRLRMSTHIVRQHLAHAAGISLTKRNLYYREEGSMTVPPQKNDPPPRRKHRRHHPYALLPVRIMELIRVSSMTATQLGNDLGRRRNTVGKCLKLMMDDGEVERLGHGKSGDPYIYYVRTGDNLTPPGLPMVGRCANDDGILALSAKDWKPAETEATTSPVVDDLTEVDTLAPAGIALLDRGDAYVMVIEDLLLRADAAINEAKIMTAAATLLTRIMDGEAERSGTEQ